MTEGIVGLWGVAACEGVKVVSFDWGAWLPPTGGSR